LSHWPLITCTFLQLALFVFNWGYIWPDCPTIVDLPVFHCDRIVVPKIYLRTRFHFGRVMVHWGCFGIWFPIRFCIYSAAVATPNHGSSPKTHRVTHSIAFEMFEIFATIRSTFYFSKKSNWNLFTYIFERA